MPNPIVHFEIPADDVGRAQTFYQKTFGWKIKKFPMPEGTPEYWGVTTKDKTGGIDGGLMKRMMPGQPFMNYVTVNSIDAFLQKVEANGGTVALPKQEIGANMGWIAAFKDTEGNLMGLHQMAPKPAKPKTKVKPKKNAQPAKKKKRK